MALYLLQQSQLENCYREANKEIDDAFDITNSDGLDDETGEIYFANNEIMSKINNALKLHLDLL